MGKSLENGSPKFGICSFALQVNYQAHSKPPGQKYTGNNAKLYKNITVHHWSPYYFVKKRIGGVK